MRAVRFHETGGPEVLRIEDVPVPEPGSGEVRVRVDAVGLNRADVNFRRGTYVEQPRLPAGLGVEAAGEVTALGPDVTGWAVGDAVSVIPTFSANDYPMYAEEALAPVQALVARPDGMDAVTGAAIWMPYVTVYGMVEEVVRTRPGDHVLVSAAANSIGMAALQVLRYLGAVAVATGPPAQHQALRAAGATAVVGDGEPLDDVVASVTGGRGFDLVLDANGGPGVEGLVRACAPGATVVVHGGLSGQPTPLPGGSYAAVALRRYHVVREVTSDPVVLRRAAHFVRAGLACEAFAPVVDKVFAFDDVAAAHAYVDSPERGVGKPVLVVPH